MDTTATEEEKLSGWKDSYGVLFTADRKKLIKADKALTTYHIPEGVEIICRSAFAFCRQLESVTLPSSVRIIGVWAFNCCSSLTHIELNEGLQAIEKNIFINCPALKEVTIPQSVAQIGNNPFPANTLNRLTCLSPHFKVCNQMLLTADGKRLISYFGDESQVFVPQGVEEIGNVAFLNSPNLIRVSLPNSLKRIGCSAFANCEKIKYLTLPLGLTSIGHYAFEKCNLSSLILPPLLKEIGENPFKQSLTFFRASLSPHFVVHKCSTLYTADHSRLIYYSLAEKKAYLPQGLRQIDPGAFYLHLNLEEVSLPSTLTDIGQEAFAFCTRLQLINLPSSLKNIGHMAFVGCKAMQHITILPNTKAHYTDIMNQICCEDMVDKLTELPF